MQKSLRFYLVCFVQFLIALPFSCNGLQYYLYVDLQPYPVGMFSTFSYVAGVLNEYEKNTYAGMEVNFEDHGLYYDPTHGPNWWEYYCEPIKLGNKKKGYIKRLDSFEYVYYASFAETKLSREDVRKLIQKYIKVKNPIQKKVDDFVSENFVGHSIISVHYRGTDKSLEAPRVPYDKVVNSVNEYIKDKKFEDYRIFLATDEQKFVDYMQQIFPNIVITYDSKRSTDGKPVHLSTPNNYQVGEEALIDCLLLSRGDVLIRTSSNLSLWSSYFNPKMPVVILSNRYHY
jgi:hypothetical protein